MGAFRKDSVLVETYKGRPLPSFTAGPTQNLPSVIYAELNDASEVIHKPIPSNLHAYLTELLLAFMIAPKLVSQEAGVIAPEHRDPEALDDLLKQAAMQDRANRAKEIADMLLITIGYFPDMLDKGNQGPSVHSYMHVGKKAYHMASFGDHPAYAELGDVGKHLPLLAAVLQQLRIKQEFASMRTLDDAFNMVVRMTVTPSPWFRSVGEEVMNQKGDAILKEHGYLTRSLPPNYYLPFLENFHPIEKDMFLRNLKKSKLH